MSYDTNPYYFPERHGLTIVGKVDLSEPDYSFDYLVCWRDTIGNFYLGTDSGCSCPSPFEDYNGVADMTGPLSRAQAIAESRSIYENSRDVFTYDYETDEYNRQIAHPAP